MKRLAAILLSMLAAVAIAAPAYQVAVLQIKSCGPPSCTKNIDCIGSSKDCKNEKPGNRNCNCVGQNCGCRKRQASESASLQPIPMEPSTEN